MSIRMHEDRRTLAMHRGNGAGEGVRRPDICCPRRRNCRGRRTRETEHTEGHRDSDGKQRTRAVHGLRIVECTDYDSMMRVSSILTVTPPVLICVIERMMR